MNKLLKWAPSMALAAQVSLCGAATPTYGIRSEASPAADAAAWSLVGLLVFCLTCFALSAIIMRKRAEEVEANPPEEDNSTYALPDNAPSAQKRPERLPESPSWERDGDWWKK